MEVWHTIIDYTKRFDVRATGSTVVARFSVNPYNPKPQHQFIIPSYEVTDGVKVRMKICSDAACTNVIAEEGKMVEFAAGTFVYVKYDLYYNSSVLGMKVKFAAKDNYGDYVGEKIETLSPVTLFCESDYVTPMSGDIKVHCLGGMLTAAGKKFGSDYRFLSKLTMDGVPPSGGGDINRVNVGNDFVIHVNASADNLGDTINIRVENAALDVLVSNDTSPEYVDGADYYTKAEVDQKIAQVAPPQPLRISSIDIEELRNVSKDEFCSVLGITLNQYQALIRGEYTAISFLNSTGETETTLAIASSRISTSTVEYETELTFGSYVADGWYDIVYMDLNYRDNTLIRRLSY